MTARPGLRVGLHSDLREHGPQAAVYREMLDPFARLVIGGAVVRGRHSFGVISERGGVNASWGEVLIEVAKRGGRDIVRPRHPDTWLRLRFAGTPAYLPHPRWACTGRGPRTWPHDGTRPSPFGIIVSRTCRARASVTVHRPRRARRGRAGWALYSVCQGPGTFNPCPGFD